MHAVTSPDGTRIAYDRTGTGDPLVLVGGAFSYRRYPGQVRLAELLAARFTVYNYDRRGRGDSGDTAPYATEREIEDLAAVIGSLPSYGISVMCIDHNLPFLLPIAHRIVVLDAGVQIYDGSPQDVAKSEAVVTAYLGTPNA